MGRYFTQGTPMASYEAMMMSVPRYPPRGGGRRRINYQYKKEDLDCKLCTEYEGKGKCAQEACPYLAERLMAGTVSYISLVSEAFRDARSRALKTRLTALSSEKRGCLFVDDLHRKRMDYGRSFLWPNGQVTNTKLLGTLFLMSSSSDLWRGVQFSHDPPKVQLSAVTITADNLQDYVLLQMARSILDGNDRLSEFELSNRFTVDDKTLSIIIDAKVLAKFGTAPLEIRMGQGKNQKN